MKLNLLSIEQKAELFDEFLKIINKSGRIYGSNQIYDMLEEIAIEKHYVKCPYCKREGC